MSVDPMLPAAASSAAEPDPESTAKLPVLDAAPEGAADELPLRTDSWVAPDLRAVAAATPMAEDSRPLEASLQAIAANLRETQELLASKGERLIQVERARDEAYAACTAAEQRAAQLVSVLTESQADAAQHAARCNELTREKAAAEGRVAQLGEELAQSRALVAAAHERASQLQSALEEHAGISRQRSRELEDQQALADKDRARAASVIEELRREQARAGSYLEALQTAEGIRRIVEDTAHELRWESEARETRLARLGRELADRDTRVHALESELEQHVARLERSEQQGSSCAAQLTERDSQLRDSRSEVQMLQASIARLQDDVSAAAARVSALDAEAEQHRGSALQQQRELQRLLAERSELNAALESARAAATATSAQAAAQGAALAQRHNRIAELETALAAERQRAAELEGELSTVRGEMLEWAKVLQRMKEERDAHTEQLTAAESRTRALQERAAEQLKAVRVLQVESGASLAHARELEGDLRAAEDAVNRLESEARGRQMRVEELEEANRRWRARASERGQGSADGAVTPVSRHEVRPVAEAGTAPLAASDGTARLLINTEDGRDVVRVLGRKTSIGRTPDNDLQIDAKFVSRHHCVILAGPVQTIVEDLNSTNGVMVNGKRVARHALKDGDQVVIGRALYRFVVRKNSEKR